jgi:hypothetical protein
VRGEDVARGHDGLEAVSRRFGQIGRQWVRG